MPSQPWLADAGLGDASPPRHAALALAPELPEAYAATPGLVPPSALKGDAMLRLRALCNEKELELLELRGEHNQLIARFAEARANMEEALEVKDRTIDALASALDAREEALERNSSSTASLEEVQARILQLHQRTAVVEAEAEKRTASARRYKNEAKTLRGELAAAQAARAEAHAAAVSLEQRLAAALAAERDAAAQAATQAAAALAAEREATAAALRRATAAEGEAAALRAQLAEAERVRAQLARILSRLAAAPAAAAD